MMSCPCRVGLRDCTAGRSPGSVGGRRHPRLELHPVHLVEPLLVLAGDQLLLGVVCDVVPACQVGKSGGDLASGQPGGGVLRGLLDCSDVGPGRLRRQRAPRLAAQAASNSATRGSAAAASRTSAGSACGVVNASASWSSVPYTSFCAQPWQPAACQSYCHSPSSAAAAWPPRRAAQYSSCSAGGMAWMWAALGSTQASAGAGSAATAGSDVSP